MRCTFLFPRTSRYFEIAVVNEIRDRFLVQDSNTGQVSLSPFSLPIPCWNQVPAKHELKKRAASAGRGSKAKRGSVNIFYVCRLCLERNISLSSVLMAETGSLLAEEEGAAKSGIRHWIVGGRREEKGEGEEG